MMVPRRARRLALLLAVVTAGGLGAARLLARGERFDHAEHARLFPSCESCHRGVLSGGSPWPEATSCATCHDGTVEKRVTWDTPSLPRTNLAFEHGKHAAALAARPGVSPDSATRCATCHIPQGAGWMHVTLAATASCLACHGVTADHLAAPDTACATCHLPLPRATRLTREDVADFPEPASHKVDGFALEGHGRLITPGQAGSKVPASCATCHARDFCLECHVNAPETPAIQALAVDPRSTALRVTLAAPPSHGAAGFLTMHGRQAGTGATCATCHTQESCATCHAGAAPRAVRRLAHAGKGRAVGAVVTRQRPPSHGTDFTDAHGKIAAAAPRTCSTCHARTECLSCHLPSPGQSSGYHPAGFLARHPAAAYARQTSCADCHNSAQFCASCHAQAGLRSNGPLQRGFHDANPGFLLGHGKAARQELETCVTCHAERDCLTCHAAQGGRRFNPHGPGFDAERLRRKNPEMCTACHGAAIPGGS